MLVPSIYSIVVPPPPCLINLTRIINDLRRRAKCRLLCLWPQSISPEPIVPHKLSECLNPFHSYFRSPHKSFESLLGLSRGTETSRFSASHGAQMCVSSFFFFLLQFPWVFPSACFLVFLFSFSFPFFNAL